MGFISDVVRATGGSAAEIYAHLDPNRCMRDDPNSVLLRTYRERLFVKNWVWANIRDGALDGFHFVTTGPFGVFLGHHCGPIHGRTHEEVFAIFEREGVTQEQYDEHLRGPAQAYLDRMVAEYGPQ